MWVARARQRMADVSVALRRAKAGTKVTHNDNCMSQNAKEYSKSTS